MFLCMHLQGIGFLQNKICTPLARWALFLLKLPLTGNFLGQGINVHSSQKNFLSKSCLEHLKPVVDPANVFWEGVLGEQPSMKPAKPANGQ